jgi:hyperosmotically inducible periplasmic protein
MRIGTVVSSLLVAVAIGLVCGCASTKTSESTGEYFDNAAITAKIKSAYATDPVVKALSVHVSTVKGVVQLTGTVSSNTEKKRAEEIARSVAGVTNVKNGIVVKP